MSIARKLPLALTTLAIAWSAQACALDAEDPGDAAGGEAAEDSESALSPNDQMRFRWARFVRATVQPRLIALGAKDIHIKRATWFGLSEGIFTISGNSGYGQAGGPQSPLGFSNCGDTQAINKQTALPDCFGAEGFAFKSGNWQVGIAGAQVSDAYSLLPKLYHDLYGDLPPRAIAESVLRWLGEDGVSFPSSSIEELACAGNGTVECKRKNARWVSVILRDPALNVYIQTHNSWIRDEARDLGFGKSIIDAVWQEAGTKRSSIAFAETGQSISGRIAKAWQSGNGAWECWQQNQVICLAAYGLPVGPESARNAPISGTNGVTLSEQRFERQLLQVNQYGSSEPIVQGALLGAELKGAPGKPGEPVHEAFAAYYARYGGLPVFGYPIGPAVMEGGRLVQYFERARLEENSEFDPNISDPVWEVLRGHLGRETE
jgi:hypothetical protein